jgi:predicted HTH domain antitoxin
MAARPACYTAQRSLAAIPPKLRSSEEGCDRLSTKSFDGIWADSLYLDHGGNDTKQAVIEYPSELPELLKLSDLELTHELLFLAAAKLYEIGRLSSGKAARLAGMSRMTFLRELDRIGVPAINLRDEQIEAEIRAARELAG